MDPEKKREVRKRGTQDIRKSLPLGEGLSVSAGNNGVLKEVIEGNMAKGLFAEVWTRLRVSTRDVQASRNYIQESSNRDRGGSSYQNP